jgi:hypothetical protein
MKTFITTPLDKLIFGNPKDAQKEKNSWGFKIGSVTTIIRRQSRTCSFNNSTENWMSSKAYQPHAKHFRYRHGSKP